MSKALRIRVGTPQPDGTQQRSPGWLLVFVPFSVRDTKNSLNPGSWADAVRTEPPIVVRSDCVALQVSESKAAPTGQLTASLRGGNINYAAAVAPGDYVFAWMSSDMGKLDRVARDAAAGQACNQYDSGLKFVGRVMSVRERLSVEPSTGVKQVLYTVVGSSFWEFTSKVYFNPILFQNVRPFQLMNDTIKDWSSLVGPNGMTNCQDLVMMFIRTFMGYGPGEKSTSVVGLLRSPNGSFLVPNAIASMLGRKGQREKSLPKYTDILDVVAGVQKYSWFGDSLGLLDDSPWSKLQPNLKSSRALPRQKKTAVPCSGNNAAIPNIWQDIVAWSLMQSYANTVVNELFTVTRVDGDGRIVPTLVMRQIPFTTPEYIKNLKAGSKKRSVKNSLESQFTNFFELPRWVPDPSSVYDTDVGRTEAGRFNFVQVWGMSNAIERGDMKLTAAVAGGNYFIDENDVRRSGIRLKNDTSNFDYIPNDSTTLSNAPAWAQWVADWVVNSHLKFNGSITMLGVDQPIAIGDNFEWRGVVYHIEQVSHSCSISGGLKTFRTVVSLSNGLDVRSESSDVTVFPGMDSIYREHAAATDDRADGGLLPGYTDLQVTSKRAASGGELNYTRPEQDMTLAVKVPPREKKGDK